MPSPKRKPLGLPPHGKTARAIDRAPACRVSVSARLPVEVYCKLLALTAAIETKTGHPVSNQQVFIAALERFIDRHKAWKPAIESPLGLANRRSGKIARGDAEAGLPPPAV